MSENLPATVADEYGTGLEDLDTENVQVPRIKVDHPNGVFKDELTGDEFSELSGVFLGMVRQRIMWRVGMDPEEKEARPQCKSNDAANGFPNMDSSNPEDHFPWNKTGLNPQAMEKDEHGRIMIPCAACPFSQWGGTRAKPKPPLCAEMHTYPVMYRSEPDDPDSPIDRAGVLSFKGSGISPSKAFLKGFSVTKRPVYSSYSSVTLTTKKRGMVTYSVPTFVRGAAVPPEDWPSYGEELKGLREFLRQPPRFFSESEDAPVAGSAGTLPAPQQPAYVPQQRTAPEAQTAEPAGSIINQASGPVTPPAAAVVEEELPF